MELDQVDAFVAIVRRGGFTAASEALHRSQPAITRRVQLLERELGAPLFERLHHGVLLTEAGHAFLPHAEALLAAARDGLDAVRALRGTGTGAVTLALVGTLASTGLTERLRQFREAYPDVELGLRTALSKEVSALVLRADATLGLRYGQDANPDLVTSTVYHEPLVPVCAPTHRLAEAKRVTPKALAAERWIGFPSGTGSASEPYVAAFEQRLAASGASTREVVAIDSLTAQKRMVEAGFGVALLPRSSVDEELRAGTLRVLAAPAMRVTIPVVLIRRRRAFQSGAARALATLIADWR
jgi:DNA-binding transcriptional LysR family regulator